MKLVRTIFACCALSVAAFGPGLALSGCTQEQQKEGVEKTEKGLAAGSALALMAGHPEIALALKGLGGLVGIWAAWKYRNPITTTAGAAVGGVGDMLTATRNAAGCLIGLTPTQEQGAVTGFLQHTEEALKAAFVPKPPTA